MTYPTPNKIAVRCFTEKPPKDGDRNKKRSDLDEPSEFTLVFDCETTIDEVQALRFGFYQIREGVQFHEKGLFYCRNSLTDSEIRTLKVFAEAKGFRTITVDEFRKDVFLKVAYHWGGLVVGFNLPFDFSRIAIGHGAARRHLRGGFSFKFTNDRRDPALRIRHLDRKAAMFGFAAPKGKVTGRSGRKAEDYTPHHRGYFCDLKTLGAALTSRSFSLASLAEYLGVPTQKQETSEHGKALSETYLAYARDDVQATWECYLALSERYAEHGLESPAHRILSEASVGKAYLKDMGLKPLLECQPNFPRVIFGKTLCAYYGGRAEVHIRRVITEVIYCDFKSMYPTVNTHMGLWSFVIADGMTMETSTEETQALLNNLRFEDFQNPIQWQRLTTLVRLKPHQDLLPTRAKYDGKVNTIGLNYLTSDTPLWFTLADVLVSVFLTGKVPNIEEAISFKPGPAQKDLKSINLLGRDEFRVDPLKDDAFKRLIDLRDEAKRNGVPAEKSIKITANSTSYGIFIEVIRDNAPKSEVLHVYGFDGVCRPEKIPAIEKPGRYFNPLLGVLITDAARLMLALAEKLSMDAGLDWVFCDTDSLAIARPDGMDRETFRRKAQGVINWFEPLNPYEKPGSILQMESQNFALEGSGLAPLYAYAISSKRYDLFNLDENGQPILRKASAHGLGHLIEPYTDDEATKACPKPQVPLSEIGVRRWQHDFWIKIIEAALAGHPDQVDRAWHPALKKPAASRYGATSPDLLKWMDTYNEGKPYEAQIRPFGFILMFQATSGAGENQSTPELVDPGQRGRPLGTAAPKPIAPFDRDPAKAAAHAFCRETGQRVCPTQLRTYAQALTEFHISPESKFENGEFLKCGTTKRRHIVAESFVLIGKEANKVGESGEEEPGTSV